jgi:hypothetical protein
MNFLVLGNKDGLLSASGGEISSVPPGCADRAGIDPALKRRAIFEKAVPRKRKPVPRTIKLVARTRKAAQDEKSCLRREELSRDQKTCPGTKKLSTGP